MTGPELKAARLRLGMTQRQLGAWMGRRAATISLYENGHQDVPLAIERVVDALESGK